MREDRGVTTALAYIQALAISAILVSSLLVGLGGFFEDQREQTARTELDVIGEQFAGDIAAADRLIVASDGTPTVELHRSLPPTVVGLPYSIELDPSGPDGPILELSTTATDPKITVRVPFTLSGATPENRLELGTVDGGDVVIRYDSGKLVVANA